LWGWFNEEVCQSKPRTPDELDQQIQNNLLLLLLNSLRNCGGSSMFHMCVQNAGTGVEI